ncbi:DUF602-domain-containing protein [Pseudovirgaria hyperparasitica]|uniref:DUF602-domain-containing protein n=1 Tax=Pseudovirgaria hyperparasitica TaxID=470096 RepID=A0A6A6WGB2_9PEZI|nr:DUF602-domain-containing protein [Pseudovirgaria hyperparasitica]KAF2761249.1 DUF602-domain-containing protein [Pseudovirgaria hyperparasitica]
MGNDGGSIPTRRELVKEAARNPTTAQLKETRQEKQEFLWTTDPISNRPLEVPVVSDCAGRLYNKETILEYLLPSEDSRGKEEADKILEGSVKSLKDIVEVKFVIDEDEDAAGANNKANKPPKWKCPLTNKPLGPGAKAVYIVPCGHAFVAAAIKEVSGEKCPQCEGPYASNDVVPILPTEETDIARLLLRETTLKEQGLAHSLKKQSGSKKRKKHADKAEAKSSSMTLNGEKNSGHIKNSATASLTAKVMAEQDERNKKRKINPNENLKSLFTSNNRASGKNTDFMTRGFTVTARDK